MSRGFYTPWNGGLHMLALAANLLLWMAILPQDEPPRQELTPAEERVLSNGKEHVPFPVIDGWLRTGRFEAAARAYSADEEWGAHWIREQGKNNIVGERNRHDAFQRYLDAYYPKLAREFREGRDETRNRHEKISRIAESDIEDLDAVIATFEDSNENEFVRRAAIYRLEQDLDSPPVREFFTRYVLEGIDRDHWDEDKQPYKFCLDVLLRSGQPWATEVLETAILSGVHGWQRILELRRSLGRGGRAWLLDLAGRADENVKRAILNRLAARE